MATVPIDLTSGLVGNTGDVYWSPESVNFTNDLFPTLQVLIFKDPGGSDKFTASVSFRLPDDFVSTPEFLIEWTATATSGNVSWVVDYVCVSGSNSESLDPSGYTRSPAGTDAAPSTTLFRKLKSLSGTSGDFAAGDRVLVNLSRSATSDTMTGVAILTGFTFTYVNV